MDKTNKPSGKKSKITALSLTGLLLRCAFTAVTNGYAQGFLQGKIYRGKLKDSVWLLVIWGALWGFWFGWIMDLWYALAYVRPLRGASFFVAFAGSFMFDALHAATNAVSLAILYRPWRQLMKRLMMKYQILPKG